MERIKKMKVPEVTVQTKSNLAKWVPLICMGTAVGIGFFALKEIKNVRSELVAVRNEPVNKELTQKLNLLEKQLEMLKHQEQQQKQQQKQPSPPPPPPVVPKKVKEIIKDIIEEEKEVTNFVSFDPELYEEVEVTDDEDEPEIVESKD
jgi:hypothetical protein